VVAVIGIVLLPLLGREVIVYKAGVVLIFFVAAIGLHVLVNWAGQLSLAHASMVGLPAFCVLALSEAHGISPIYLLPVALVIGALVGAVVALPTLRAKDLQVALVTLVAGIAINRFFFTQTWLVGRAGGRAAATPRLGPLRFDTSRSLYPLLVLIVVVTVLVAWAFMHSKLARAWFWVQANPAAASAFGIPVVVYRIGAYAIGGAFGGLAGGLTVMWVQRLGQDAFPATLSFGYLLTAVLAGPGFVGGLRRSPCRAVSSSPPTSSAPTSASWSTRSLFMAGRSG
jgi:branched-chain amino acid transport system permease protein